MPPQRAVGSRSTAPALIRAQPTRPVSVSKRCETHRQRIRTTHSQPSRRGRNCLGHLALSLGFRDDECEQHGKRPHSPGRRPLCVCCGCILQCPTSGRSWADARTDAAPRERLSQVLGYSSFVSNQMVKGPEFSRSTVIIAPNSPTATSPRSRSASAQK